MQSTALLKLLHIFASHYYETNYAPIIWHDVEVSCGVLMLYLKILKKREMVFPNLYFT